MRRIKDGCSLIRVCKWQFCVFRRFSRVTEHRPAFSRFLPALTPASQDKAARGGRRNNRGRAAPSQEQQSPRGAGKRKRWDKGEIQIKELTVSSAEQVTSRPSPKGEKAMSLTRSGDGGGDTLKMALMSTETARFHMKQRKKLPEWQEMWVTVHWPSEPGFTEVRPSMPPPAHTTNKSFWGVHHATLIPHLQALRSSPAWSVLKATRFELAAMWFPWQEKEPARTLSIHSCVE